jgi:hypothetical protein
MVTMRPRSLPLPLLLLVLGGLPPALADNATAWPLELSGACRLPDGRFLLVDDETKTGCFLWDGKLDHPPIRVPLAEPLDDLEAAAADSLGRVYLLTSHSLTKKGAAKAERRHLARLSGLPQAGDGPDAGSRPVLEMADDLLEPVSRALGVTPGEIDLEGLAWYPASDQLLLGARRPLTGNKAHLVGVGPIAALFPSGKGGAARPAKPRVWRLDLGGRGIRGLDYDPWQDRVWVLAGPPRDQAMSFVLYRWDPKTDHLESVAVPGLETLRQPESVVVLGPPTADGTPILVAGEGAAPAYFTAGPRSHQP